jgi:hypothetical protein
MNDGGYCKDLLRIFCTITIFFDLILVNVQFLMDIDNTNGYFIIGYKLFKGILTL